MAFHWRRRDAPNYPVDDPLLAELQAEIADHLAELEEDCGRRGESPAVLQERVRQRFGDAERVIRKCRWEHRREIVFLRAAVVGLSALVLLVTGVFTVNQWRFQTRMDRQVERFVRQVAAVGEAQAAQAPPGTLTGYAYSGQSDRPVAGARVSVYAEPIGRDAAQVRELVTDREGRFRSGGLPLGKYFVLASLLDDKGVEVSTGFMTQSRPVELTDEAPIADFQLDLLARGELKVSLTGEIADTVKINDRQVRIGVAFEFVGPGIQLPFTGSQRLPEGAEWPIVGGYGMKYRDSGRTGYGYQPSEFPISLALPSGQCRVLVFLLDRNLVLDAPLGQAIVLAELGEAEATSLTVRLPEDLKELRHAGGPWKPLPLEASVVSRGAQAPALLGAM